jgi:hypothetical protein
MTDPPAASAVAWHEFLSARPDLAAIGREFFYHYGVGLGFLATVRRDGGPRVHPISPILMDDDLYALIVPGPKLRDLRSDDRYALHCETFPPPRHDDAFYIAGVASEVRDRSVWDRVAAQLLAERDTTEQWPGFEEMVLFEFRIERCLLTLTKANDTFPAGHTIWRAPPRP